MSVGALQSALKRLDDKGFLASKEGEGTSARGGRPKRYFEITASGKRTLVEPKETRNTLWDSIPKIALDSKFIK